MTSCSCARSSPTARSAAGASEQPASSNSSASSMIRFFIRTLSFRSGPPAAAPSPNAKGHTFFPFQRIILPHKIPWFFSIFQRFSSVSSRSPTLRSKKIPPGFSRRQRVRGSYRQTASGAGNLLGRNSQKKKKPTPCGVASFLGFLPFTAIPLGIHENQIVHVSGSNPQHVQHRCPSFLSFYVNTV